MIRHGVVRATAQRLGLTATSAATRDGLRVEAPDFAQEGGIRRLWKALQVVERLGIPVDTIVHSTGVVSGTTTPEEENAIAHDLRNTVKARYEPENRWRSAQPTFDRLRQRQRVWSNRSRIC